jgi:hypothetical protein
VVPPSVQAGSQAGLKQLCAVHVLPTSSATIFLSNHLFVHVGFLSVLNLLDAAWSIEVSCLYTNRGPGLGAQFALPPNSLVS